MNDSNDEPNRQCRPRTRNSEEANRARKKAARAKQNDDDRLWSLQRRQKQRKRTTASTERRVAETNCNSNNSRNLAETEGRTDNTVGSADFNQRIDEFLRNSVSTFDSIYDKCSDRLSNRFMAEKVCCTCDSLHPNDDIVEKETTKCQTLVKRMQSRLTAPTGLPLDLQNYYDCSDICELFKGLLLSRKGLCKVEWRVIMQFCSGCLGSLSSSARRYPPKFAIANGLFIGRLPSEFNDSTMSEHSMVNLAQPTRFMTVVRGGKHSSLRSHAYYFRAEPSPPAELLPRDIVGTGSVSVKMVGALTSEQKVATMARYRVRMERLRRLLNWYYRNNHLYESVREQPGWEKDCLSTRVVIDETVQVQNDSDKRTSSEQAKILDQGTWRFNAASPPHHDTNEADEVCECVSSAIITDFIGEDHISAARTVLQTKDVVVFRSTSILSDFDPSFWTHAFCELFPFGRGGLDEPRNIAIGLDEYIRYCLRLSSRCHAQHPSFTLVGFDVRARQRAIQAIYLMTKVIPNRVASAGAVTREALMNQICYQEQRIQAIQQNRSMPVPPRCDPHVGDLTAGISTGMRAYWGSNQERLSARAELFSMQLQFGQPSIFFTISPNTSTIYRIANICGEMDDQCLSAVEDEIQNCLELSKAKLGMIATSNPFACARYFDRLMHIFIDVIFDWDISNGCSRRKGGLFGRTTAYFASTESQNSTGSLHSHMLIWIEGMPTTVSEYNALLSSDTSRCKMLAYVTSLVTANAPGSSNSCPSCGNASVSPLRFSQQAFRKPGRNSVRPSTSVCTVCEKEFGSSELLEAQLSTIPIQKRGVEATTDETLVFRRIAIPKPLDRVSNGSRESIVTNARALLTYQQHLWSHTKSCFKITKRTPDGSTCRMFFPKEVCEASRWTSTNRIDLKRDPGNEYINPYSPLINELFKTNHDIKFLAAGEGPEKSYYTIKYTAKPQRDIENPVALHLFAFDKARSRIQDCPDDPVSAGRRCIQSMCCTLSNPHEVSAPMATLYLVNGSPFYSSHEFVKLYLSAILGSVFDGNLLSVTLQPNKGATEYKPSSLFLDYTGRPMELENLCLMEYVAGWYKKHDRKGKRFVAAHVQHDTHSVHRRKRRAIVTVINQRLPDIRKVPLLSSRLIVFRRTISTLFRPFRRSEDFGQDCDRFDTNFASWWGSAAAESARKYAHFNNDYYESRELVQDKDCDDDVMRFEAYSPIPSAFDDMRDIVRDDDADEFPTGNLEFNDDGECDDFLDGDSFVPRTATIKHVSLLEKFGEAVSLVAQSIGEQAEMATQISNLSNADLDRIIDEAENESKLPDSTNFCETSRGFPHIQTLVRLVVSATADVEWTDPAHISSNPNPLRQSPSLREVSLHFRLNRKQHEAFVQVGTKLLESFVNKCESENQFRGFLGGLPGAGKSQVIRATQKLAALWGNSDAVATVAYQGVAAQSAGGQTIHRLFGWRVNGDQSKWRPTVQQIERFHKIKLLIVDEISTCDVHILGRIDSSLRSILKQPSIIYGGIHILLVGDWLQQLPVAGQPAYIPIPQYIATNTAREQHDAAVYFDRIRGAEAYRQVNNVVMLNENMRHRMDPSWRGILKRWRIGAYLQADIDLVNSTCYTRNWRSKQTELEAYCPIIVTSNTLRTEFNASATQAFCIATKRPLHRFPAALSRSRFLLTSIQRKSIQTLRDDKTGSMPAVLDIVIGIPIQCTKNVSTALKLANGTIGYVVGFSCDPCDNVGMYIKDGIEYCVHSKPPQTVFAKLVGYERHLFIPHLPAGVVPIRLREEKGVLINMPGRTFKVTIEQVPIVPAFALTSEKCQGLTVDKMILGPLRHRTRHSPQRSSFYVAVTRVKTLQQLYLMEPLTLNFLQYFTPRPDALEENSRLEAVDTE